MHAHLDPSFAPTGGRRLATAIAIGLAAILLAACQRGGSASVAPPKPLAHPAPVRDPGMDPAVVSANRTMAAGVPVGDSAAPVDARFDLDAAPIRGVPFAVGVAILPGAPVPLVRLDVSASEGLVIVQPESQVSQEKVAAGTVVPLQVSLLSAEAGTRVLTVKATLELPDGPQSRTFAFPLIVGAVPPAPAPSPVAPTTTARPR